MEKLTKALMTDETGQEIVTKLTALSGQMHELAMATRGNAILFESESDISVLGDGGYLAVYVGSTNPLVISGWTGDNSLVTGNLYYLVKSGTDVASSDLGEYGGSAVTDTTLTLPNVPADSETVGLALAAKADSDDVDALDDRVTAVEDDILELQDGGYVADQQKIAEKINDWLEEHPEATTVQDGSITQAKLNNDVKTGLQKRVLYVSLVFGNTDNDILQNAIDYALSMESCTLIIDKTLNITRTIDIVFTWSAVQALTIQGLEWNVKSSSNVFHGDANPTLRNNMVGCINCNVSGENDDNGVVFNVVNRNDTNSFCVKGCVFFNGSTFSSDNINGPQFSNTKMTLFRMDGCVPRFFNNTAVGFDYFIYAPSENSSGGANWTGDHAEISDNTIYSNGHGIRLLHADYGVIQRNTFSGLYGYKEFLDIEASHACLVSNNGFGAYIPTISTNSDYGIIIRGSVATVISNHGENSWFNYLFGILGTGTVTFIGNQHTTTKNGRIMFVGGTCTALLVGNSYDTTPLKGYTANLINAMSIDALLSVPHKYVYVNTASDWDEYKSNQKIVFANLTTSIRSGYTRGFFESVFDDSGIYGTQTITWIDGFKSIRTYWYNTFSQWHTES